MSIDEMFKSYYIYSIAVLIVIFSLGEFVLASIKIDKDNQRRESIAIISTSISRSVQKEIVAGVSSVSTLEILLKVNNYNVADFDIWAQEILATNEIVRTLQLAPNGLIQNIYPMEGNEAAIGHDLLSDPKRRLGAMAAINDRSATFIGPLRLMQNNQMAFITRKPIMVNIDGKDEFWGFTIAIIYIEQVIGSVLSGVDAVGIRYTLYGNNPDSDVSEVISSSSVQASKEAAIFPVMVPNGTWYMAIEYMSLDNQDGNSVHFILLMISILISVVVFKIEKTSYQKSLELEVLNVELQQQASTDSLTGVLNRRSSLAIVERQFHLNKRNKSKFSAAFFDLDFFKKINDKYGHDVGDKALCHFVGICVENHRCSDVFCRWGGEEFMIFMPDTGFEGAGSLCNKIRKALSSTPLTYGDVDINMTVSIGISGYREGDDEIDDIVKRADAALYKAKMLGRNRCEFQS